MIYVYVALGLLAVIVIAGFLMPSHYALTRKITIAASPAEVHAFVGDLARWPEWMPWEQEDPSVITSRGEQTTGVGATQSWTSKKSGDGEVEFTAWDENTGIAYDMVFIAKDKRAPAKASIRYTRAGDGAEVTWSMESDFAAMMPRVIAGLMKPVMCSMIAKNFVSGLECLKEKVEAA